MSLPNLILNISSTITRKITYFRGLSHIYRILNAAMLKVGASRVVCAKMKDGTNMLVDLTTNTELDAYYRGEYDSVLIGTIKSLLNTDSYFLDVGANIGFYTISIGSFIKSKGKLGKVIAFEPFQGNYNRLIENIVANNLEDVCSVRKFGLSNISSDREITLREDFRYGSSTGNAAIPTNEEFDKGFAKVPIRLESLDIIWENIDDSCHKIDILKIDIEGHEDFCLKGAKETIQRHRPTILMEVNKPYYVARDVELDRTFLPLIPDCYSIFHLDKATWKRIHSFNECRTVDNVFLIPEEKLGLRGYEIFSMT